MIIMIESRLPLIISILFIAALEEQYFRAQLCIKNGFPVCRTITIGNTVMTLKYTDDVFVSVNK